MSTTEQITAVSFPARLLRWGAWVFQPSVDAQLAKWALSFDVKLSFLGGTITLSWNMLLSSVFSILAATVSIGRFEYVLDLLLTPVIEDDGDTHDVRPNHFHDEEPGRVYDSWFLGFEGIGLCHNRLHQGDVRWISTTVGVHPLITIGAADIDDPRMHDAMLYAHFADLQASMHARWKAPEEQQA